MPILRIIFLFVACTCLYREKYSISRAIYFERQRPFSSRRSPCHENSISLCPLQPLASPRCCAAVAALHWPRPAPGARRRRWSAPTGSTAHRAIRTWSCSTSARRSTAAARRPTQAAHIPGSVHSDYDKAGWRVTRNDVPFMVPTVPELEKLIGDLGIDEDEPCRRRAGRRERARLRLRRADLLDAEGTPASATSRFSTAALPPGRRRACRSRAACKRRRRRFSRATLDKSMLAAGQRGRERSRTTAAPRLIDARPASFFPARRRRRPRRPTATFRARSISTAPSFYDPATNRLKPKDELAAIASASAGRSGGGLLQHRALGGDRLVRAARIARPTRTPGSTPARWWSGPAMPAGRSQVLAHAMGRSEKGARPRLLIRASDVVHDRRQVWPRPRSRRGRLVFDRPVPGARARRHRVLVALVLLDGQPASRRADRRRLRARRRVPQGRVQLHRLVAALPDARRGRRLARRPAPDRRRALAVVPVAALAPEFGGAIAPLGPSLIIGAFVFGIGMQLANGCGSGTLYTVGGGSGPHADRAAVLLHRQRVRQPVAAGVPALGGIDPVLASDYLGPWGGLAATLASIALAARADRRHRAKSAARLTCRRAIT